MVIGIRKLVSVSMVVAFALGVGACGAAFKAAVSGNKSDDNSEIGRPTVDGEGVPGYLTDPTLVTSTYDESTGETTITGAPGSVAAEDGSHRPDFVLVGIFQTENKLSEDLPPETNQIVEGELLISGYPAEDGSFTFTIKADPEMAIVVVAGLPELQPTIDVSSNQFTTIIGDHFELALLRKAIQTTWYFMDCVEQDEDEGNARLRFTIEIGANETIETAALFENEDCTGQPTIASIQKHSFAITALSADVEGGFFTEKKLKTHSITTSSEDLANSWKTDKYCGSSAWTVGKPVDVTEFDCGPPFQKHKGIIYDFVQISGNELRFGKTTTDLDGTTPEKRPVEIDPESKVTKK